MGRRRLPDAVQLPSGRVVSLKGFDEPSDRRGARAPASRRAPKESLVAELVELMDAGAVVLRAEALQIDVRSLALCDFHALRAILTRLGWLSEEAVEITCRNCDRAIVHHPCAALELGPFVHRELNHPELDATLELGVPHPIPDVRLGKRSAREVTLGPLRVVDAAPLHAALAAGPLRVGPDVVRAMGIVELGGERSPHKIARALVRCPDDAWDALTNLFLEAHYPPRLMSIARCPECGARNDVDAPADREFSYVEHPRAGGGQDAHPYRRREPGSTRTNGDVFPSFDAFDERAHAAMERVLAEAGLEGVSLIVEGGVAACDDGGEPLLGSYAPPYEGDMTSPAHPPTVSLFYRTFRAVWEDDGPYDWQAELDETVEHEVAHHLAFLDGDDPVDEAERREIAEEEEAVVGKRALAAKAVGAFRLDLGEFVRRTWPIWLIVFIVSIAVALGER